MGNGKKAFSKKEKIIGAIVITAMLALPFIVAPVQQGYASNTEFPTSTPTPTLTSIPISTPVEKIQTIVVPLNGTKYIDLNAIYNSKNMYVTPDKDNGNVANGHILAGSEGILEIKGGLVGKATFTVSGIRYEPSYSQITDTFEVIVIPNKGNADEFKFDISNVVNLMKEFTQFQTVDQVQGLLSNVDPKTVMNISPFNHEPSNSAPYPKITTSKIVGTVQNVIPSWKIADQINHFFNDDNDDILHVYFLGNSTENMQINTTEDGSVELMPLRSGDFDLDVLVADHSGGMAKGKIPFHINNIETFYLDTGTSITVDLSNYFSFINANTNFNLIGASDYVTISGTKVTFTPTPDTLTKTYTISAVNGDNREDRKFRVTLKDGLVNRSLILGSQLNLNLQSLLVPFTGSSVTYSVYLNSASVTGLTYGIDHTNSLYLSSEFTTETNNPIDLTITAKDETNHVTIKDKLQVSVIPMSKTESNRGFKVAQLFTNENEWTDAVVSSSPRLK
ncbi:hypothetical protein SAMN04487897_11158 [Paenibacillus sp. yr247]|nr:hypothetical protein SAMN04487897_11158 [Paenibacillus sp. yr247]